MQCSPGTDVGGGEPSPGADVVRGEPIGPGAVRHPPLRQKRPKKTGGPETSDACTVSGKWGG